MVEQPKRPKTGGRQKGTPNRMTKEVKEALWEAFDNLGGVESLVEWGRENPTPFYALWGKLAPLEANVQHSGEIGVTVNLVRFGDGQ